MVQAKILVKGKQILPPLELCNAVLTPDFKRKLKHAFDIDELNNLQRHVWPHIDDGRHCVIVGGENRQKGKSLSYLMPLSLKVLEIQETLLRESKAEMVGPAALILASTYASAAKISVALGKLTFGTRVLTCIVSGTEARSALTSLEQNPDFIVTTVNNAIELFEKYYEQFRFDRLRYVVFDDCHQIFDSQTQPTQVLMQKIVDQATLFKKKHRIQRIFCSQKWDRKLSSAAESLVKDPVLIIGSSLNATFYGGVELKVLGVKREDRVRVVADLIKNSVSPVVVCVTGLSARILSDYLKRRYDIISVTPSASPTNKFGNAVETWNSNLFVKPAIIATDNELMDLNLRNVTTLIHYEIPYNDQEMFWDRHNTMWEHFPELADYNKFLTDPASVRKVQLTSHVLFTEISDQNFRIVIRFKQLGIFVPDTLLEQAEEMYKFDLKSARLCENIVTPGKCNERGCKLRHFFLPEEVETVATVPKVDRIEVSILQCIDVNRFLVKLCRSYNISQDNCAKDEISYLGLLEDLERRMTYHYNDPNNCATLENPVIGSLCVVRHGDSSYARATIVKVFQNQSSRSFRVYLWDYGEHVVRRPSQIFELAEQFKNEKRCCVELVLANLQPKGMEGFSNCAKYIASALKDKILTGKVALMIGTTIWVSHLREYIRADSRNREWMLLCNVRTHFLDAKIAEDNPYHMDNLYKLVEDAGVSCEHYARNEGYMEFSVFESGNAKAPLYAVATTEAPLNNVTTTEALLSNVATTEVPLNNVASTEAPLNDVANPESPVNDFVNTEAPLNNVMNEIPRMEVTNTVSDKEPAYPEEQVNNLDEENENDNVEELERLNEIYDVFCPEDEDEDDSYDEDSGLGYDCYIGPAGYSQSEMAKEFLVSLGFNVNTPLIREKKEELRAEMAAIAQDLPINAHDSPVNTQESPVNVQDSPVNPQDFAVNAQDSHVNPQHSPVNALDSSVNPQDSPVYAQDSSVNPQDSPVYAQDSSVNPQDSPVYAQDSSLIPQDSLVNPQDFPVNAQDSPVNAQDSSVNPQDSPVTAQDSSVNPQDSPVNAQDPPVDPQHSPANFQGLDVNARPSPTTYFPIFNFNEKKKKPKVEWSQTNEYVELRISIPNLSSWKTKKVTDQAIEFTGISPPNYYFQLNLFAKFNEFKEAGNGNGLTIKLFKSSTELTWPRLTYNEVSWHWLKPRLDNIDQGPSSTDCDNHEKETDDPSAVYFDPDLD